MGSNLTLRYLGLIPPLNSWEGDIRDAETCQKAREGIDYVSHQAALGSVPRSIKEPIYFNEVNVGGFVNMLKAAVDNKVKISFMHHRHLSTAMSPLCLKRKRGSEIACRLMPLLKRPTSCMRRFLDVYGLRLMGFRYFNIFATAGSQRTICGRHPAFC